MIAQKNYMFLLLTALIFLGSCKEKTDIMVPGGDPLLVIESAVTTEIDSSYVKLTLSSNYFNAADYPVISKANVRINGVAFSFDPLKQLYKPGAGFVGKTDSVYNLLIEYNGKNYTSQSKLDKMFRIDSFFQTMKPKEGFLPAGFSVSYAGYDGRPRIKYTYFVNGFYDTITHRDSFNRNKILFNSSQTPLNKNYVFEIPFTRYNTGDEFLYIFRSIDKNMNDFIEAFNFQSSAAPGPFQVPPANLPTNVVGGAVGYFATYDVIRGRYKIK
ncbi:MAG: DUF4249 family protein [Bacteroidia bacterium]|nr:DUF4249 family protein [Bacteroidia bacterium]